MAWFYLIVAGLLEVGWAVFLKQTDGFTRLWPSAIVVVLLVASLLLLSLALREIPIGTGYAVWTGIGAAGTAAVGMAVLGESREALRVVCLALIVAGVLGLKFAGGAAK